MVMLQLNELHLPLIICSPVTDDQHRLASCLLSRTATSPLLLGVGRTLAAAERAGASPGLATVSAGKGRAVAEPLVVVAGPAHRVEACAVGVGLVEREGLVHRVEHRTHARNEGLLQRARLEGHSHFAAAVRLPVAALLVGGDNHLLVLLHHHLLLVVILLLRGLPVQVIRDLPLDTPSRSHSRFLLILLLLLHHHLHLKARVSRTRGAGGARPLRTLPHGSLPPSLLFTRPRAHHHHHHNATRLPKALTLEVQGGGYLAGRNGEGSARAAVRWRGGGGRGRRGSGGGAPEAADLGGAGELGDVAGGEEGNWGRRWGRLWGVWRAGRGGGEFGSLPFRVSLRICD
uniref:Uncharacterized protein n=1 Tax=Oryza glumipatula TaxID=40148 RepID=A0A0D9Z4U2_9ORYZ